MQEMAPRTSESPEDESGAILHALRRMPDAFTALFAPETEETLHHRPADGEWSAVEVVCHLADHDAFERTQRFDAILTHETPALPVDTTRFTVTAAVFQSRSAADALAFFARERARTVALLERLHPQDWLRIGLHPRDGMSTLLHVADLRGHDREHLDQAAAAIAAAKR